MHDLVCVCDFVFVFCHLVTTISGGWNYLDVKGNKFGAYECEPSLLPQEPILLFTPYLRSIVLGLFRILRGACQTPNIKKEFLLFEDLYCRTRGDFL